MSVHPGYPYPPSTPAPAAPQRIEAIQGTDFGLAYAALPPIVSGQAVGALVAGIGSIVVALFELCLGLYGAGGGWGAVVAGAFGILSSLMGAAAIVIGVVAMRGVKRSAGALRGHGLARTGVILGIVGVGVALASFFGALIATLASN